MSHGIALTHNPRRSSAAFSALRMLMLSLLMLLSTGAWADPVRADQLLSVAKQFHAQLKMNHQIAKLQLQAGQTNAAVVTFHSEKINAAQLTAKLVALRAENQATFQNGQYLNGEAQQRAISHNDLAKTYSMQLEMYLTILTMNPTSQIDMVRTELEMQLLETRLASLEQFMIAAQQ